MQRKVIRSIGFAVIIVLNSMTWAQGLIYKCQNQQGIMIYQKSACMENSETVTTWTPADTQKVRNSDSETDQGGNAAIKEAPILKLAQNSRGHYSTEASINDKPLTFVVDTGATIVSLPENLANSARIYCDNAVDMTTANGVTDGCTSKISKLQFGPFVIQDVAAIIMPKLSYPLLGMNVLQMFKIAQENGEMHISYREKNRSYEAKK